jgi:DNA-binding response OmpR family regulator
MKKEAEILGHEPFICPSSGEAMQHVLNSNPDIIMVDVNMQEFNGFQVVQQIRNHRQAASIPVFILSAGDPDTEEKKALDVGANGFLMKPLTVSGLENAVNGFINQTAKFSYALA